MLAAGWLLHHQHQALRDSAFYSGYALFGCVLFLSAYNFRKKFPALSIGASSHWLQAHIYVAIFSGAMFGLHVGWRIPDGYIETSLATCFTLTFASGLYGLAISRSIPRRLAKLREEYIFEQIPALRHDVRQTADRLVVHLATQSASPIVVDFYASRLVEFFFRPRGMWYYLRPTNTLRRKLQAELKTIRRYCSEAEQTACQSLSTLIDRRDDMDYHEALQGKLKLWLFVHIGLTYSLIIIATYHMILAHAFDGGWR